MVELEEGPLGTAATIVGHESAPAGVTELHRAFDLGRDVT